MENENKKIINSLYDVSDKERFDAKYTFLKEQNKKSLTEYEQVNYNSMKRIFAMYGVIFLQVLSWLLSYSSQLIKDYIGWINGFCMVIILTLGFYDIYKGEKSMEKIDDSFNALISLLNRRTFYLEIVEQIEKNIIEQVEKSKELNQRGKKK